MANIAMPSLSKTDKAALTKSAQHDYMYELRRRVRELAMDQANMDAKAIIQSIVESDQITARLKVMQLINKPTNET